jgi:hypothetical protein
MKNHWEHLKAKIMWLVIPFILMLIVSENPSSLRQIFTSTRTTILLIILTR